MALTGLEKAVLMLLSLDEGPRCPWSPSGSLPERCRLREVAVKMRAVPTTPLDDELHQSSAGMLLDGLLAVST